MSSVSSVPSVSSVAASIFGTGTASASITSADWMDPSATGGSSGFLDSSNTNTTNADAYFAADSALSTALSDSLSNLVQGQATLAGQAALDRVNAAIKQKQASTSAPSTGPASSFNGFSTVQNLMSSLDNITINNGSAPPAPVSSSTAANGYAVVQNLMNSFDNITINGGLNAGSTGSTAPATGQSLLQSIDALLAKAPTVNVTA
jgi:hypothetical protein